MKRKLILAGVCAIAFAGAAYAAYAGLGRAEAQSNASAANQTRPAQTLLSQFQSENASRQNATPVAPIAPTAAQETAPAEPVRVAQAPQPTELTPAATPEAATTRQADSASSTSSQPVASEPAAQLPRFQPTSGPAPRSIPQRTRANRQVAATAMCR